MSSRPEHDAVVSWLVGKVPYPYGHDDHLYCLLQYPRLRELLEEAGRIHRIGSGHYYFHGPEFVVPDQTETP